MIMKRKTTKRKSIRRTKMPSWNEVRIGLSQVSKLRLLFLLAKIYRSSVNILSMAKTGAKRVVTKRKTRKTRSAAQKRATRKLVAFNRRRR